MATKKQKRRLQRESYAIYGVESGNLGTYLMAVLEKNGLSAEAFLGEDPRAAPIGAMVAEARAAAVAAGALPSKRGYTPTGDVANRQRQAIEELLTADVGAKTASPQSSMPNVIKVPTSESTTTVDPEVADVAEIETVDPEVAEGPSVGPTEDADLIPDEDPSMSTGMKAAIAAGGLAVIGLAWKFWPRSA